MRQNLSSSNRSIRIIHLISRSEDEFISSIIPEIQMMIKDQEKFIQYLIQ